MTDLIYMGFFQVFEVTEILLSVILCTIVAIELNMFFNQLKFFGMQFFYQNKFVESNKNNNSIDINNSFSLLEHIFKKNQFIFLF